MAKYFNENNLGETVGKALKYEVPQDMLTFQYQKFDLSKSWQENSSTLVSEEMFTQTGMLAQRPHFAVFNNDYFKTLSQVKDGYGRTLDYVIVLICTYLQDTGLYEMQMKDIGEKSGAAVSKKMAPPKTIARMVSKDNSDNKEKPKPCAMHHKDPIRIGIESKNAADTVQVFNEVKEKFKILGVKNNYALDEAGREEGGHLMQVHRIINNKSCML